MSKVSLLSYSSLDTAIHAMSNCYGKQCTVDSLAKACKAGHWSLLEHVNVSIDITCSQKVLAQISRHRHFSMTVQSTRGMDITGNGFYSDFNNMEDTHKAYLKQAYSTLSMMFGNLLNLGVPVEQASYILPLGTQVSLTMTGNLRCWLEYLKKRLCKRASDEHQQIARQIFDKLKFVYPSICNLEMLGMCENCKELSCDFTSHKKKPKEPVRGELK